MERFRRLLGRLAHCDTFIALLFFILITIVVTHPAVWRIRRSLIGDGDAWLFVWNIWWAKFSLWQGLNAFCTDFIHFPTGVCAYLHTWVFSVIWPSIPLQWLLSPITIYNLFTLASFPLAALGMFLLGRSIGLGFRASLAAGIAFSFNPYHFAEATGHLNLLSYQWIPFFLASYMRGLSDGWSARRVAAAAAWLLLVALTDWYYLVFCFIAMGLLWLARVSFDRSIPLKSLAMSGLVAGLVLLAVSPLLIGMVSQARDVPGILVSQNLSPDLLSFGLPGPSSSYSDPLMRWWPAWSRLTGPASIPWMILLLAPFGISRLTAWNRRWLLFWVPVFFILSLGPALHVNGQIYERVMLPFALLEKLPGAFLLRVPLRFHLMTFVALSILFGLAVERLAGTSRWKAAVICLALLVETASIPFGLSNPDISPLYYRLSKQPPGALRLIDLSYNSRALFYQTLHRQKLLGLPGMVSRQTTESMAFLKETPGIRALLAENQIQGAVNGSAALGLERATELAQKGDVCLVISGHLLRGGRLEISSDTEYALRLDDTLVASTAKQTSVQARVEENGPVLLTLRLRVSKGYRGPSRLSVRLNGEELDERSALAQPIIPTVRIQMRRVGLTSVFLSDAVVRGIDEEGLAEIRRLGFDWIIIPFYGNDHYARLGLGLRPEYSDRWLEAYRIR